VVDILDLNIHFGQGHLFGEPRAIKEAVLSEAGPPPNLIRPQFARRQAYG
jgi:cyclic-di-GMP phosphodiesterase TipF (flagellum assembly factor)